MNRKRRSKICCLSGILLLILLLAGVQRVSAMTTRTELYQNTPSDGGRSGGKEKQLLANSYAGEYQIDFSYGFEGNYQDGNHVPIRVTITNESAVEFEGYFVFQIKNAAESIYRGNSGEGILSKLFPGGKRSGDGRNSLFTYRFPIYIPANGTVTKTFSAGLLVENTSFCVLRLENSQRDTVYSREETISSEGFFQSKVEVCVVEEETNYGQQLNGVTLNDGIYEVEAASVRAEELVGLAESYSPDVLILLEQSKEELDETLQKEIDLWQAEGGLLITFSGNETFAESQRSAFKEAPVDFLKNILDEETTSRLLAKRNTNYQKYYTISDLLENTKIRNRPNTVLYGGLILVYLVLAGPGLYFFLKKTGKRQYLWGAICACSAVFVMLISLFGQSTRLKAPVLTYVREIWQYDTYQKDYINFCAQAPYNASYELYLDPSYDLVTYNRMDYMSNSTAQPETEDAEYEKTEISFGEQKNRAEISNQAAFALNGLDMEVKKGDIYGFVGPNGAGKTTTLRIISGLLKSDGGDLWLDGVRTTKNILKQKSLIGFVPDFFGVYENLNVIEYLEFFAASYGIYGRVGTVRAREVLEMVELSGKEEQMVDSLSRGIQQRLCLARAMIHKPKLLVLDEPNSGLDPRSRKDFQLLLQRLAREDYTILISSHILSELADLCTSIGVINGGVMVQQGKLENIMLAIDSSNPLRITVLNQVPKALELLRQDPQVSRLSVDENKIAAWFSGSREEEAYLLQKLVDAGILVVSFAREHNSLESLFFHLTGETEQKSRNTETFGNTIG